MILFSFLGNKTKTAEGMIAKDGEYVPFTFATDCSGEVEVGRHMLYDHSPTLTNFTARAKAHPLNYTHTQTLTQSHSHTQKS